MKPFEFLDHTADVKFKAYGKSLEELFTNAAKALLSLIVRDSKEKIELKEKKELTLETNSLESLLFDFLEELIVLLEGDDFIFSKMNLNIKNEGGKWILHAELFGDRASKYNVWKGVKAVTYSDFYIKENKGVYEAQIILDI